MSEILQTTSVGSFPKPPELKKARRQHRRGEISDEELTVLEEKATQRVIQLQQELGLDILVHGEMERGDMATYFAEQLDGMAISGLVRSFENRFFRQPVAEGPIRRTQPMSLVGLKRAKAWTEKPLKGIVTGPYTLTEWAFNNFYPSRRDMLLDFARVVHEEALDLEQAGAAYVQIDEPALSTRPEDMDVAIEALDVVTDGLEVPTINHICFGHFETIYPKLLNLPVDIIDLETSNNDYEFLALLDEHPFTKKLSLGVLDVHSHRIETVDEIKDGIYRALEYIEPENLLIDPDCGLKTRTWEQAEAKLKNMVQAVRDIRAEIG